jgi:hypothetical protein
MGCCCAKQPEKIVEKKKLSIEELKKKYAKVSLDLIIQENEPELRKIINEGFQPDLIYELEG